MKIRKIILPVCLTLTGLTLTSFTPESTAEDVKFSGYLLADADYFDEFYSKADADDAATDSSWHSEIRALKVSARWKHENLRFKGQYKWQSGGGEWGDLLISYRTDAVNVFAGRSEPATSQEANMSYKQLPVIERSLPVRAFAAGQSDIAGIDWRRSEQQLQLALFRNDDDHSGVQLRFSQQALADSLLWAVAAEQRDLQGDNYQIKTRAAAHLSDKVIRSPRFYADQQNLLQADIALINDLGWFSAEYWLTSTTAVSGDEFTLHGSYWQWVYNTRQSYRIADFETDSRRKQLTGSWDYVVRVEWLDLQDQGYGARASNWLAGVNYHPYKNLSLMANLIHSQAAGQLVSSAADAEQASGNALSLRLRYLF